MARDADQIVAAMAAAARLTTYDGERTWHGALFDGDTLSLPGEPDRALLRALAEQYVEVDRHADGLAAKVQQEWLERVLRIARLPVVPDRVVAAATVDPERAPVVVPVDTKLRGGKDAAGIERRYATLDPLTAHGARVVGVRTMTPQGPPGTVAEGPPFPLDPAAGKPAPHRLRIHSPLLAFPSGDMKVKLTFAVPPTGSGSGTGGVAGLAGADWTWSRPDASPSSVAVGTVSGNTVTVKLSGGCGASAGADPWLEMALRPGAAVPETLAFTGIDVSVTERSGVAPDAAYYNDGALDVSKEFQPFGAVPQQGDAFYLRCDEALAKPLSSLWVTVGQLPAPPSGGGKKKVAAAESAKDKHADKSRYKVSKDYREHVDSLIEYYLDERGFYDEDTPTILWQRWLPPTWQLIGEPASRFTGCATGVIGTGSAPFTVSGQPGRYLRAYLAVGDFGWADYQADVAQFATDALDPEATPTMPTAPKPPVVGAITIGYTTSGQRATRVESVSGWRRQTAQASGTFRPFRKAVSDVGDTGMVAIGLELPTSAQGSSVSVYIEVESAAPCGSAADVDADWEWWDGSVWQPLPVADGTRELRESGLLRFVAPTGWQEGCPGVDADTGRWVRMVTAAPGRLGIVASVTPDAVVAAYVSAAAEPDRDSTPETPLPLGAIKGLVTPIPGVKKITNLASTKGRGPERDQAYRTRASARIRHRGRTVVAWDYEEHVRQGFPEVAAVRCLPHTATDGSRSPGMVGIVVVPDRPTEPSPLPSVSLVGRIADLLRPLMPVGAEVAVLCPEYEPVRVVASIRLRRGVAALSGLQQITERIEALLHPTSRQPTRWGLALYSSEVVSALEGIDVVDVVGHFELRDQGNEGVELVEVDACRGLYCSAGRHDLQIEEQL